MRYSPLRFIPNIFIKRPIHLTLFLTSRCNQNCHFCFYKKENHQKNNEISVEEIEKLSPSLGRLLWLAFSGGEVFLREDIVEISKIFYEKNTPSIMLYPTNASLPEIIEKRMGKILSHCRENSVVIKISIDGIGKKHDLLRGYDGSFDKALDTYRRLSRLALKFKNLEVGVNSVFCFENQDDMEEIIEFVRGLKIDTHTISLIRGGVKGQERVDIEKYKKAIKILEKGIKSGKSPIYKFNFSGLKAAQDILQRDYIYRTLAEKRGQVPCLAGRLNLVITESGEVYPCEAFDKKMGNLKDFNYDIRALLRGTRAKEVLNGIKRCFCTHECYFITNIFFNPRTYPSLLRQYISVKL